MQEFFPQHQDDHATVAPGQAISVSSTDRRPLLLTLRVDVYGTDVGEAAQVLLSAAVDLVPKSPGHQAADDLSGCLNVIRSFLYESHNPDPPVGVISNALDSAQGYQGGASCVDALHFLISEEQDSEPKKKEPSTEEGLAEKAEKGVGELRAGLEKIEPDLIKGAEEGR